MTKQRKADLWLVLITGFWGVSYILSDLSLTEMAPMSLNAFRFLVAFAVLAVFFRKKMHNISRETMKYAFFVGMSLVGVYTSYIYGLMHTSVSNAGFICSLPGITTPILEFIITRKKPKPILSLSLVLCTVGLALLTLNEQFRPALGDILCLGVAIFYAIDLVVTDRAVHKPEVDPLQMGILELGIVGVVTLVISLIIETPTLPQTPTVWAAALFLGIFCTGIAFVVQTVQQQYTNSTHVGLIFMLEPVFAAIAAYFFADEVLTARGYFGAVLMMVSLLLMELDLDAIKAKLGKR